MPTTVSGSPSYTRTVIRRLGLAVAVLVVISPSSADAAGWSSRRGADAQGQGHAEALR